MHKNIGIKPAPMFLALALGLITPAVAGDKLAEQEIRQVISTTYDKPEHKVETAPIAVDGDYAVADWVQGSRGGRALMHRVDGKWKIAACGADNLKDPKMLVEAGIAPKSAEHISRQLAHAEESLSPERQKLFSLFGTKDDPLTAEHHHHAE